MNHFKIIRNAHIYAPKDLGTNDILLCGNKIAMIDKKLKFRASEWKLLTLKENL